MKIDAVFSGGGVKAYAFIGALQSIENNRLQLERVAGTSAGAIIAAFWAARYRTSEMLDMLSVLDIKKLLDPPLLSKVIPFSKWLFFYFQMGLYKGDFFEKWLYHKLLQKGIETFSDLEDGYLKVVVSDLSLGKLIIIPDDLKRVYNINPHHFRVAKAVRMSAGFPYFFMPKYLMGKTNKKSIIADGGLLSNFPLWVFEKENHKRMRPVLGIKLSESIQNEPRKIKNALDMLHALFSTMKQAHDTRYITKSEMNNIIFIPVKHIKTTDFNISDMEKDMLIQLGKERADDFLKRWPK